MATYRTQSEWAEIKEAYRQSGQTQTAWCREHGISAKTLGAHIRGSSEQKQVKRSAETWAVLIAEQKNSGMSRTAWCKEHGISPDSMTSAEKRLNARSQKVPVPEWVELIPETAAAASPRKEDAIGGIKIRGGGLEIEIDADYPVENLAFLIGKLVKQC